MLPLLLLCCLIDLHLLQGCMRNPGQVATGRVRPQLLIRLHGLLRAGYHTLHVAVELHHGISTTTRSPQRGVCHQSYKTVRQSTSDIVVSVVLDFQAGASACVLRVLLVTLGHYNIPFVSQRLSQRCHPTPASGSQVRITRTWSFPEYSIAPQNMSKPDIPPSSGPGQLPRQQPQRVRQSLRMMTLGQRCVPVCRQ